MAGEIIWSPKAKSELIEILEYWVNRNKSNVYSLKLNQLIQEQLIFILELVEKRISKTFMLKLSEIIYFIMK